MPSARDIEYEVDGTTMVGRLAIPDGDQPRPGVLICHEGPGLDDNQRERAAKFADLGFACFALDYHGGGRYMTDRDEMGRRLAELSGDPERIRRLAAAGLDILAGNPTTDATRIAALGYCFGGAVALELGRAGADLKAIVGFHPGLAIDRHQDDAKIRAKVLMCVGSEDPLIPQDQRRAFEDGMTAAGVDWQMVLYGGAVHSFTHPNAQRAGIDFIRYDHKTDERSWKAMLALLDEAFA
jgi:dienelactone hydrolase